MLNLNYKKKWIMLILCVLCLLTFPLFGGISDTILVTSTVDRAFSFSYENGFYNTPLQVELRLDAPQFLNLEIHYTLDGNTPTAKSPLYQEPFKLVPDSSTKAVIIKAIVYNAKSGAILGGPYTATYFVGKDAVSWTDAMVVSITTDHDNLYSEDRGILLPAEDCGPTEEDWKWFEKQNCKQRGDEWVRDAHVDIFEPDGTNVISQNCGLCIDGDHGSMIHYPYSLKLLAGSEYDEKNPFFSYDFFQYHNTTGTVFPHIQKFNNLVFRNGGNEYNAGTKDPEQRGTMIRWNIGSRLADEAGFLTAGARTCVVFLNGEFYGVTQLQDTYNRYDTSQKTGLEKDYIEIFKDAEKACTELGGYADLYYSYPDIGASPIFGSREEFERVVSMDDMFLYYAYEVLINNTDFPKKNYAIWRYFGVEDPDNPFSDGKYRFLINDLDCTYDFRYDDDLWTAYFNHIKEDGTLMGTLVQIEEYKARFINILCDLLNSGLFDRAHMEQVINEANALFNYSGAAYYSPEDEAQRQRNVQLLKESAFSRPAELYNFIDSTFSPKAPYTLCVQAPEGGAVIQWSTSSLTHENENFSGAYYGDYPLTFTYETNEYREFSHWLVNGKAVKEPSITVDSRNIIDGRIHVQLVTFPSDKTGLVISEVCAQPGSSWVELYNPTEETVTLSDYMLTNDPLSPLYFSLPHVKLNPGEIFIAGTDNTGAFRILSQKTVFLTDANKFLLDSVTVPVMADRESYGRYGETDEMRYYINPSRGKPQ